VFRNSCISKELHVNAYTGDRSLVDLVLTRCVSYFLLLSWDQLVFFLLEGAFCSDILVKKMFLGIVGSLKLGSVDSLALCVFHS
jgi:hypothetical protein